MYDVFTVKASPFLQSESTGVTDDSTDMACGNNAVQYPLVTPAWICVSSWGVITPFHSLNAECAFSSFYTSYAQRSLQKTSGLSMKRVQKIQTDCWLYSIYVIGKHTFTHINNVPLYIDVCDLYIYNCHFNIKWMFLKKNNWCHKANRQAFVQQMALWDLCWNNREYALTATLPHHQQDRERGKC